MNGFVRAIFLGALIAVGFVPRAEASTITCPTIGSYDRQATLSNVLSCTYFGPVSGTPKEVDVEYVYGGDWSNSGSIAGPNGFTGSLNSGWLTIAVTSGSWGALPVSGTWGIDPALWAAYGRAALTIHLGNGAGNPDWFFFEITNGSTSGIFDVQRLSGGGGGLSNFYLWTSDPCEGTCTPTQNIPTPEPGSLLLLGTGLTVLAMALRKRSRS